MKKNQKQTQNLLKQNQIATLIGRNLGKEAEDAIREVMLKNQQQLFKTISK